jgi:hypothetical protein
MATFEPGWRSYCRNSYSECNRAEDRGAGKGITPAVRANRIKKRIRKKAARKAEMRLRKGYLSIEDLCGDLLGYEPS